MRWIHSFRPVALLLETVFLEETQRYMRGWSHEVVAVRCATSPEFVVTVIADAFSTASEASKAWRMRQAVVLVAHHFDHLVELTARDQIAADDGGAARGPFVLHMMQAAGSAPSAGRWDAGWNDDRVAELVGLDAGEIREIRDSIPWVAPELRAEARWRRFVARYTMQTRAGRILRLAAEIDPQTGEPYTPAAIIDALAEAGESQHPTPAALRRDVERIETMIRVTRARLDPETGAVRVRRAIAAEIGMTPAGVHKVIQRIDSGEMAPEGRPSLLTAEICERVEAANPLRVDRRSVYRWLIGWIWLRLGSPPTDRTLKGWRKMGAEHVVEGIDSLAGRFELAVRRLLEAAPVAGPELPTVAEIDALGMRDAAAADALGVTREQLAQARKLKIRRRVAVDPDRR